MGRNFAEIDTVLSDTNAEALPVKGSCKQIQFNPIQSRTELNWTKTPPENAPQEQTLLTLLTNCKSSNLEANKQILENAKLPALTIETSNKSVG